MSGSNILTGRVWKFGDNISTDLIMPSFGAMSSPNMDPHEAALFHDAFEEGETIEVNMETGEIRSLDTGRTIRGEALPSDSPPAQILRAGGLIPMLEKQLAAEDNAK